MTEPPREPGRFSPISPDDLIHHAGTVALHYPSLVYTGGGPSDEEIGRVLAGIPFPSSIDFRRAVSAAYYAVFHAVTLRAARLVQAEPGLYEQHRGTRRFEHRDVRNVALWATGSGTPPSVLLAAVEEVRRDAQVRAVATAIQHLSDERRNADYNHFAEFTQNRALRAINRADDAVEIIESHTFARSNAGRAFLEMVAEQARARS